jgi:hypothetical protein
MIFVAVEVAKVLRGTLNRTLCSVPFHSTLRLRGIDLCVVQVPRYCIPIGGQVSGMWCAHFIISYVVRMVNRCVHRPPGTYVR